MDQKAGELETSLGVTITGRVITELEMAGGTGNTLGGLVNTLADGFVLEAWRFDYRLQGDSGTSLTEGMSPDGSGWLAVLGGQGKPALLALRDDLWHYTPIAIVPLSDLEGNALLPGTAQAIADGAAAQGFTLTADAWGQLLPGLLYFSRSLETVPDGADFTVTAAGQDRVDFTYRGEALSYTFDGQTWTLSE